MSFTDGKPWTVTDEDTKRPWMGNRKRFRCRICGQPFRAGDVARFVFANFEDSPSRHGNFLVCSKCDGADVLKRAGEQEDAYGAMRRSFGDSD